MNLIEEIQSQQARVRELLTQYEAIGPSGMFGAMTLRQALQHGDKAVASGDVVAMLVACKELEGCTG